MLKYQDIINKLTVKQKLKALCGFFGDAEEVFGARLSGYRTVMMQDLDAGEEQAGFPSFKAVASSWDTELINRMSKAMAIASGGDKPAAVITPNVGVMLSAYGTGVSEDPYLSAEIATACAKGIASCGYMHVLDGCGLSAEDADYTDKEADKYLVRDYMMFPYERALREVSGGTVLVGGSDNGNAKVRSANAYINNILKDYRYYSTNNVFRAERANHPAAAVGNGLGVIIGVDYVLIEKAYNKYKELEAALGRGELTKAELTAACEDGSALSEAALDRAVDKLIEFGYECARRFDGQRRELGTKDDLDALIYKSVSESVVLLKNEEYVLPLESGVKIAVVGAEGKPWSEFLAQAEAEGVVPFSHTVYSAGYGAADERNDELVSKAVEAVNDCDTAVVFCGRTRAKGGGLGLPPNQSALLDALKGTGKTVVAVIPAGVGVDVSFEDCCDAIITLPGCGAVSNDVLAKVLSGDINPSGRLTYTLYSNSDKSFGEYKERLALGRVKAGAYFGYRGYAAEYAEVVFPFGHGLSYTEFQYTGMGVDSGVVRFRIKNIGKRAGAEVAQVYAGLAKSKAVRPPKELQGFVKVFLEPGQSKVVTVSWQAKGLAVNDSIDGERKTEAGKYNIFVGSSVSDIWLQARFKVEGSVLNKALDDESDYDQNKSNIISGGYTMDNSNKKAHLTGREILPGIFIILVALFDIYYFSSDWYDVVGVIILAILNIIVLPSALSVLIRQIRNRVLAKRRAKAVVGNEHNTQEVRVMGTTDIERLFEEEFPLNEESAPAVKAAKKEGEDITAYLDPDMSIKTAVDGIAVAAASAGYLIGSGVVRDTVAAMLASRVLVIKGEDNSKVADFAKAIGSGFGTTVEVGLGGGSAAGALEHAGSAARKSGGSAAGALEHAGSAARKSGGSAAEALEHAASAARKSRHQIHLAVIHDVVTADWARDLAVLAEYASNPEGAPIDGESHQLPPNLWVAVTLMQELPKSMSEYVAVVDIAKRKGVGSVPVSDKAVSLNYHQLMKLGSDCIAANTLSESVWKRLDRLEEYARSSVSYKIGNKLWRSMERYVSAMLGCGSSDTEAVDGVIAAKLIAGLVSALNGGLTSIDGGLSSVLDKVLEGNSVLSSDAIKYWSGLRAKRTDRQGEQL